MIISIVTNCDLPINVYFFSPLGHNCRSVSFDYDARWLPDHCPHRQHPTDGRLRGNNGCQAHIHQRHCLGSLPLSKASGIHSDWITTPLSHGKHTGHRQSHSSVPIRDWFSRFIRRSLRGSIYSPSTRSKMLTRSQQVNSLLHRLRVHLAKRLKPHDYQTNQNIF